MLLSKTAIKEFKEIYYKEFDEIILDEEAEEKGKRLISLFKTSYRPISDAKRKNRRVQIQVPQLKRPSLDNFYILKIPLISG